MDWRIFRKNISIFNNVCNLSKLYLFFYEDNLSNNKKFRTMSKKIKVFYDGKCSVCKKEKDFYSKIDKERNFDWVNIHKNKRKITNTGLSKKELLSVLHIQTEKGSMIKGVDAFAIMWSKFRYLKPLSFALKFKPINIFANFLYKLWLKTR